MVSSRTNPVSARHSPLSSKKAVVCLGSDWFQWTDLPLTRVWLLDWKIRLQPAPAAVAAAVALQPPEC